MEEPNNDDAPPAPMYWIEVFAADAATTAELVTLEKAIFRKNDSWAVELPDMIVKRNCSTMLARRLQDGKVCAYVICTSTGLNLHVSKIAVREDCRRQGIARNLMLAVLHKAAKERRSCSSSLHVAHDNAPARALYRSLGYQEDGLLEDYYTAGRHAYKMICDLEPYKAGGGAAAPPPEVMVRPAAAPGGGTAAPAAAAAAGAQAKAGGAHKQQQQQQRKKK